MKHARDTDISLFREHRTGKAAAKKDLIDAKWMLIREISERTQIMACTGPDRRTCFPCKDYVYAIVAERS